MRIILDCDGVLCDTMGSLFKQLDIPQTPEDITQFNFFACLEEWHGPTMVEHVKEDIWDQPDFWRECAPMPGAQAVVEELHELDYTVRVATTPWPTCREWDYARRGWLKRHFDIDTKNVWTGHEKGDIDGDVFVDDKTQSVLEWANTWVARTPGPRSKLAYLYDSPWNRKDEWDHRVSWDASRREGILGASDFLEALRRLAGA